MTRTQPPPGVPLPQTGGRTPPLPPVKPPPAGPGGGGRFVLAMSILGVVFGAAALTMALMRPATPQPASPPSAPPTPAYTEAQITAAKTKACAAGKLTVADLEATHRLSPAKSDDDALGGAHIAAQRLADLSAALLLPTRLDPATPPPLAEAVNELASSAGEVVALSLGGTGDADHAQYVRGITAMNKAAIQIERICG